MAFFSEDNSFICCSTNGYSKYSSNNGNKILGYNTKLDTNFMGGVKMISTFYNSNLLVVVPDREENSKTVIFMDITTQAILFTLSFPDDITNIMLKRDYIIISTTKKIHVRMLTDLENDLTTFTTSFSHFPTFSSPPDPVNTLIAFLNENIGVLSIADFTTGKVINNYHAFKTPICAMKFSPTGRKIAVVGDSGRKVRVLSFPKFIPIASLKRGISESIILSLSFNYSENYLSLTSTGGTLHVFDISSNSTEDPSELNRATIKIDSENTQMFASFCLKTDHLLCVTVNGKFMIGNIQDPAKPQLTVVCQSLPTL